MAEYLDRVTGKLSSIPGYDGYRSKENRRENDRRIRDQLASQLDGYAERVERVAGDLANKRDLSAIGPIDAAAKSLRHVRNLVSTATYGYGGLFSDRDVDEIALEQLGQFDADLMSRAETLEPAIAQLETAATAEERSTAVASLQPVIDGLKSRFDERAHVVETGRPLSATELKSPLSVLEPDAKKPASTVAMKLKQGDALAIGGTNLIVDAVIDVAGAQPMRLYRVGVAPERWLIVTERFAADAGRRDVHATGDSATVDGETLPLHDEGAARATVSGLSGDSGERSLSYKVYGGASAGGWLAVMLSWDSASLSLVGSGIALDEIDIYGQPSLG